MAKEFYVLTSNDYYEGLKNNKLLGLRCKNCGQITCPPLPTCQWCGSSDLEKTELSGRGEILTFTRVYIPPEGYEPDYIVCLVRLDEGPTIMGRLDYDKDKASLKSGNASQDIIGMQVRLEDHVVIPGDKFSAGERVVPLFKPI